MRHAITLSEDTIDATRHEPIPIRRHRLLSQQRSKWVPIRSYSTVNTKPQIVYFGDRCGGDPFYHLTKQQGWAVKNQVVPQPVLRASSLDPQGPKHNTTRQQMGVPTRFSVSQGAEYSPRWASFDGTVVTTQPKPTNKIKYVLALELQRHKSYSSRDLAELYY